MITEDYINNLIKPVLDRQRAINLYVLKVIAERVKEIGGMLPSDVYKLQRLVRSGEDVKKINKELARLTNLNVRDIQCIIKQVAQKDYKEAKFFYDYRSIDYVPFEDNEEIQKIVRAIARTTSDTYVNISNTQAFMLRDLANPQVLIPTSLSETYYTVVDEAIQAVQGGTVDYYTVMRRTLNQLIDSGIRRVTYNPESGRTYTQRVDTALRRNLLDGIRAVNQQIQVEIGNQFGSDGIELTAHANSAPDHEPVQGRQFAKEEFEKLQTQEPFQDVNGKQYKAIERPIGVWNCMHLYYSIIIGLSKPVYTEEQLQELANSNKQGYTTIDGKHFTMYECTQLQRQYETKIRREKEAMEVADTWGDIQSFEKHKARYKQYTNEYRAFSKACGLSVKLNRL